ncbi:hypothetical protein ACBY01_01690 [Sphingomonas sp. ac-8]|uniref:hypothetical protein n=1 Tax=Sphingomonas sp. ac-8 TaxID=3242977 RepID=UPI003A81352A
MARPVHPLWLARPSRAAGLGATLAMLTALFTLLLVLASFTALVTPPRPAAPPGGQTDLALYESVIAGIRGGKGYYDAAADALRADGYALKPFVTFRMPTLATIEAALPDGAPFAAAMLLALATGYAWMRRLGGAFARPAPRIVALILLLGGMLVFVQPGLQMLHDIWAGLLIALSLGLRRDDRWIEAVAVATMATLIRETAALYPLLMLLLAVAEGRRREALGWGAGLGVLAVAVLCHAYAVAQVVGPLDRASPGWLGMQGFGLFVRSVTSATALELFPLWLGAPLVALALIGWGLWDDPAGLRVAVTSFAYAALIGVFARPDTFYWVLLVCPLLLVGLVFLPDGLRDLTRALLDRRRVRVQRITR